MLLLSKCFSTCSYYQSTPWCLFCVFKINSLSNADFTVDVTPFFVSFSSLCLTWLFKSVQAAFKILVSSLDNLNNDQTYSHQYLKIAYGILDLKKGFYKNLIYNCKREFAEGFLEVYENRADDLSNDLKLIDISILIFFQFYSNINKNQLKIVVEETYCLHPNEYFEILNLKNGEAWRRGISGFVQIPRHGWDQRVADFNRFLHIKTRSCSSCLVVYLHATSSSLRIPKNIKCEP